LALYASCAERLARKHRSSASSIPHECAAHPRLRFSETMRKMSSRNSLQTHFLPARAR
jgi:hypothetical protein